MNIAKSPPTPKNNNMTHNTDPPDADTPDAADGDAVYPKPIHLYLRNHNRKSSPTPKNNKNNMTPNTDAPDTDAPDAADDDSAYSYSLVNKKKEK